MTQLQTMSDQELNRKLIELLGYKVVKDESTGMYRMVNPQGKEFGKSRPTEGLVWNDYAYPFCTDHAASRDVEAKAIEVYGVKYLHNLSDVIEPDELAYKQDGELVAYTLEHTVCLLTATPRQRSEAAYITLSQGDAR